MTDLTRILRIDASARKTGSITRDLADKTIDRLAAIGPVTVTRRDVSEGVPFVDEAWITANFTPADQRTNEQRAQLALSDAFVAELKPADRLVLGLPVYNFGVPASLKAWIDQVARAGVTFKYTDSGPAGLLEGKRAIVLVASGGTPVGGPIDFATPYIRHALGFIGIHDVEFIAADGIFGVDAQAKLDAAASQIAALAA
ncbi:MAG: NAD(P)H-dependent oxidoreductase [Pseudomonadota bacterium]